jgi:hypothetical protein
VVLFGLVVEGKGNGNEGEKGDKAAVTRPHDIPQSTKKTKLKNKVNGRDSTPTINGGARKRRKKKIIVIR